MQTKETKEMKKLKLLLEDIPEDRKPVGDLLYKEVQFMEVTLNKMKKQVEKDGPIELFKQGKQEFYREHPALQGYNKTLQRYNQTIKQIADLLPVSETQVKNEFLDFVRGN